MARNDFNFGFFYAYILSHVCMCVCRVHVYAYEYESQRLTHTHTHTHTSLPETLTAHMWLGTSCGSVIWETWGSVSNQIPQGLQCSHRFWDLPWDTLTWEKQRLRSHRVCPVPVVLSSPDQSQEISLPTPHDFRSITLILQPLWSRTEAKFYVIWLHKVNCPGSV